MKTDENQVDRSVDQVIYNEVDLSSISQNFNQENQEKALKSKIKSVKKRISHLDKENRNIDNVNQNLLEMIVMLTGIELGNFELNELKAKSLCEFLQKSVVKKENSCETILKNINQVDRTIRQIKSDLDLGKL